MFLNTPGPARVLSKRKRSLSLTNLSALIHLAPSLVRITASLTRLSATASRLVPFQVVLHVTARGSGFYHKRQIRLLLPRPSPTASHSTRGGIQTPRRGLAPAVPSPRSRWPRPGTNRARHPSHLGLGHCSHFSAGPARSRPQLRRHFLGQPSCLPLSKSGSPW